MTALCSARAVLVLTGVVLAAVWGAQASDVGRDSVRHVPVLSWDGLAAPFHDEPTSAGAADVDAAGHLRERGGAARLAGGRLAGRGDPGRGDAVALGGQSPRFPPPA